LIVRIENLTKRFGATVALDGVTCAVGEGATGLLGPNGAGKTTLLRVLLGLLPARGRVEVLGVDPMRRPREVRARVGYMPESECIVPGLKGAEVVAFLGRLSGMPRREARKRAHEVLYYVGLGEARYRDADEFSTGMQQRLKLAQALVHDPDLLFLDEPTNGLDPRGRQEMLALIRELATEHGKHVVLSSHLLRDVEAVCANVVVLRRGRVAREGALAALTGGGGGAFEVELRGDRDRFLAEARALGAEAAGDGGLVIRLPQGADASLLFRAARASGTQLRGLKPTRRTLEDVFLDAMEGA
jgi:ABC-2 type transport system ATP-binding protein